MYQILPYSYEKAKQLGVQIRPSTNAKKKIDVYQQGKKIASIGAIHFSDYPTYLKEEGKAVADERRRLYHIRHKKDSSKKGTPGWFASVLLW